MTYLSHKEHVRSQGLFRLFKSLVALCQLSQFLNIPFLVYKMMVVRFLKFPLLNFSNLPYLAASLYLCFSSFERLCQSLAICFTTSVTFIPGFCFMIWSLFYFKGKCHYIITLTIFPKITYADCGLRIGRSWFVSSMKLSSSSSRSYSVFVDCMLTPSKSLCCGGISKFMLLRESSSERSPDYIFCAFVK